MQKISKIFFNAVPVFLMIGLIPSVQNDYFLALLYVIVISVSFLIRYNKNDAKVFLFGFAIMIVSECIFINTGVETFVRNSLFGLMPLWLPFLWGYSFVAIERAIKIFEEA